MAARIILCAPAVLPLASTPTVLATELPQTDCRIGCRRCPQVNLMRPELVMRNRIPLCSDCYTGWVRQSSVHWCNQVKQAANRCASDRLALHACCLRINRSRVQAAELVQRAELGSAGLPLPLPLPLPCRLRKNIMPACAEFLSSHLDPQHGLDRLAYLVHSYSPMIAIRSALASIPRLSDCFQQQSLPCLAMGCLGRYGIPYR